MQLLHKSLQRLLTGAIIHGTATTSQTGATSPDGVDIEIESVEHDFGIHNWTLQVLFTPGGNGQRVTLNVEVHWVHSTPVIVIEDQTAPGIGKLSARCLVYNRSVVGAWKLKDSSGTFAGSLETRQKSPHGKHIVIERSSEAMHDWWTGDGWSDNPVDAKWYDEEPYAGSETGNEGAYVVHYPGGQIDH